MGPRIRNATACFSVVPRLAVLVLSDDIAYENQKAAFAKAEIFSTALRYWDYKENRESWNPVSARLSRQEAGRATGLNRIKPA